MPMTRLCRSCGEVKEIDHFHRRNATGWWQSACKACDAERRRRLYARDDSVIADKARLRSRARARAYSRMKAINPKMFARLFTEELILEGLPKKEAEESARRSVQKHIDEQRG